MSSIARTAATGGDLDPAFLAWQSSLPVDVRLLEVDCAGSRAHVAGLARAGLLDAAEAELLSSALAALPGRVIRGEVELPAEEDVHMAVEVLLRRELGPVVDKLHTGRSRNDQVALDLKLWCRDAIVGLGSAIDRCVDEASKWIDVHGEVAMPAYTHRQVAIPTLARLWLDAALRRPLGRDRLMLAVASTEIEVSPLGAGAIGGTTLPIDPRIAAEALGFASGPINPIDAVGQRDEVLTLAFACARIGLHLGRFAADVVELASDGLCRLGGAVACGSSMMPHKRNPDLFELVRGQSALRQGELVALLGTFHGLGSGYHRDLQQDKQIVFAAVDGARSCLDMIALGIAHLELDGERCLAALRDGDAVATDLTELLVAGGMPFREAYRAIGGLVAAQRGRGRRLCDLSEADLVGHGLPAALLGHLDPAASARRRAARFP